MVLMKGRNQAGDVMQVFEENTTAIKIHLLITRCVKSFMVTSFMNGKHFLNYFHKAWCLLSS